MINYKTLATDFFLLKLSKLILHWLAFILNGTLHIVLGLISTHALNNFWVIYTKSNFVFSAMKWIYREYMKKGEDLVQLAGSTLF